MHGIPVGRARRALVLSTLLLLLIWSLLPATHPLLLSLRFARTRAAVWLRAHLHVDDPAAWIHAPPTHVVDLAADVGVVFKTGYATRARVVAQLDALAWPDGREDDGGLGPGPGSTAALLVVADFAGELKVRARTVRVRDVVRDVVDRLPAAARAAKYWSVMQAVEAGRLVEAEERARLVGWELDAIKFLPALQLAYDELPTRKWYLLLDDDTFVPTASLAVLLGHLDPSRPWYVGNPVGDYKARFAHGGSAVLVSRPALDRLFAPATTNHRQHQQDGHLSQAFTESLTETWGDRLLATTLGRAGVSLDERYAVLFSGEPPWRTPLRDGRFCVPLVSFHGLTDPETMTAVGRALGRLRRPVMAADLWGLYGRGVALSVLAAEPVRANEDYVGRPEADTRSVPHVAAPEHCLALCRRRPDSCLAWTWDRDSRVCHVSPAMIVGERTVGKWSGINAARVQHFMSRCGSKDGGP